MEKRKGNEIAAVRWLYCAIQWLYCAIQWLYSSHMEILAPSVAVRSVSDWTAGDLRSCHWSCCCFFFCFLSFEGAVCFFINLYLNLITVTLILPLYSPRVFFLFIFFDFIGMALIAPPPLNAASFQLLTTFDNLLLLGTIDTFIVDGALCKELVQVEMQQQQGHGTMYSRSFCSSHFSSFHFLSFFLSV